MMRRDFMTSMTAAALGAGTLGGTQAHSGEVPQAGGVNPRLFSFVAGAGGEWKITRLEAVAGDNLPSATHLSIVAGGTQAAPVDAAWVLQGVTSNERYVTKAEKAELVSKQAPLGRPEATLCAVIPIRKNADWWKLTQQERREIFEETSQHNAIGLKYLPAIARRLHHCRDLPTQQPFDFITLFDYAPDHASAFEDLVSALRETPEWKYVEREVDVRLTKAV